MKGTSALIKAALKVLLILPPCEVIAKIRLLRSRPSPDTKLAGTMLLDFLAPKTMKNKLLLFVSHPVHGISVITA